MAAGFPRSSTTQRSAVMSFSYRNAKGVLDRRKRRRFYGGMTIHTLVFSFLTTMAKQDREYQAQTTTRRLTLTSQFDSLGGLYEEFSETPFREYLEFPSVLDLIGAPRGLRILDIGCGSGAYCRRLARAGASQVTGIDVSDGMLTQAQEQERRSPQGIEYISGPLPENKAGTFDLALSVYVLPYATTRAELDAQTRAAARALRPGGRHITLPINPSYVASRDYYAPYGFRVHSSAPDPRADGTAVTLDLRFGEYDETVSARYWSAATLEGSLRAAGFTAITWQPHHVSKEGIVAHGEEFWQPYLDKPHASILDCTL